MKKNELLQKIINLASFIFEAIEFNRFMSYLKLNLINNLRIFVEEKLESLSLRQVIEPNSILLNKQIEKCIQLDSLITDIQLSNLEVTI